MKNVFQNMTALGNAIFAAVGRLDTFWGTCPLPQCRALRKGACHPKNTSAFQQQRIMHCLKLELCFETLVPSHVWVCFGLLYVIKSCYWQCTRHLCPPVSLHFCLAFPHEEGSIGLSITSRDTIGWTTIWVPSVRNYVSGYKSESVQCAGRWPRRQ